MGRAVLDGVLYFYPLILLAAVWEIVTAFELIGEDVLPRLDFVFGSLWRGLGDGELLWHTGVSLFRVVGGLVIACALGRSLRSVDRPFETLGRLPDAAFGGVSGLPQVGLAAPLHRMAGTGRDPETGGHRYLWAGASMGFSRYELIRYVVLPGSLPYIISGARITAPVAVVIIVLAEMVAARNGIGFFTYQMARDYRLAEMFVGLGVLGVISIAFDAIVSAVGRRLTHWEPTS